MVSIRFFSLLLTLVILSAASVHAADLSVTTQLAGELTWSRDGSSYRPTLADLPLLSETGSPRLPYLDVDVLLPPGTDIESVTVLADGLPVRVPGTMSLATPSLSSEGQAIDINQLAAAGLRFPAEQGRWLGTTVWHGYRIAKIRIYPLQLTRTDDYGAWASATLGRDFSIDIQLATVDVSGTPVRRRVIPGEEQKLQDAVAARVLNPGTLAQYPMAAPSIEKATVETFMPTELPSLDGSSVEYVIITTAELEASFQALADYKTARGIPTVVRTINWISGNLLPAADLQTQIREFITDAYEVWGTRFVLLGGDIELVPTRTIHNSVYPLGTGTDLPVDLYYAGIDGNWNADGDEVLGEPYFNSYDSGDEADMDTELFLGRAPVKNAAEADLFINKIIMYERDGLGPQNGYALFMSEVLTPKDYAAGDTIKDDGAFYSDDIINTVLTGTGMAWDRYYQTSEFWPGSIPETKSAVLAAMSTGNYGIVNHIGHGFFYNLSVGDASISLNDIETLSNTDNYFLMYGLNCASAAFDYNCIMEKLVRHDNGGAVAAIGASRAAFPGTASQYQKSFYEALFLQRASSLGEAVALSRAPYTAATASNSLERWTHMTLAMIGDPTLRIWTDNASALVVTRPDDLVFGQQTVDVTVTKLGVPLADATVCLAKPGDDYVVGRTDANGLVQLNINIKSAGEASLSVVGENAIPVFEMLPVVQVAGPFLKIQSMNFVDDGTLGSMGNGDGNPDTGELLALELELINTGGQAMSTDAQIYLVFDEPGVQLQTPSITLPPLAAGAASLTAQPIMVQVDLDLVDESIVAMSMLALSGELTSQDDREFQLHAPIITPDSMYWNDFPYGDGDAIPESGEEIRVSFTLRNEGTGQADGLTAWLETDTPGVTVVQGAGSWDNVTKIATTQQTDEFILSMTSVTTASRAIMHITDSLGHEWIHDFDLEPPERSVINDVITESGGALLVVWDAVADNDIQGYHVYRSLMPNGPFDRMTFQPITDGTFYRDINLDALTTYYYRLTAIDESCIEGRESTTVGGSTSPPEKTGFPVEMYAETSSHPVVGDVDGDGYPNIVTAADALYVWNHDGTELLDGDSDPLTLGPFAGSGLLWSPAGVSLANLTPVPGMEIVASCRTQKAIYVYNGDGSVADGWPQVMNNWNWAAPSIGDLDNDGDLEIVVTNVSGRTYVWHHDGTEFYDGDNNASTHGVFQSRTNEWYSLCSPALADVDNDGTLEVILATRYSDAKDDVIHALKNNAVDAAGWPYNLHSYGDPQTSPSVGDLNNDGVLEIVLVSESNLLHVIDQYGQPVAPFPLSFLSNSASSGVACPVPALGDLDNDGMDDIVVYSVENSLSGNLYAYNIMGEVLPGWPKHLDGNSESSPLIGDINGDGKLDVIFGIGGGTDSAPNELHAFSATGNIIPGFPLTFSGPVRPTPTLCDLDNDDDIDLVYGGWDLAMHVWDMPGAYDESLVPWPTFAGNPLRSGVREQLWSSAVEEPLPMIRSLLLHGNVPNPFNPSTRISFDLPGGYKGPVSLVVYDMKGRAVRSLIDGVMTGGLHHVDWHGRDDSGRSMSSGVYLYRLQTDRASAHGRMVLIR
jgi:Peptidase family C25/FG-GAP-like repeat/FlgD Ig-like domain